MKQWWDRPRSYLRMGMWVGKKQWYGGVWLWVGVVLGAGVLVGGTTAAVVSAVYRDVLRTRINIAAQALDGRAIAPLKDNPTNDDVADEYRLAEGKLSRIKEANADARFVYLMARDTKGDIYFLADSEPESSKDNSPRGERYPEATKELKAIFNDSHTVIEGPLRDSYGTWLSALAPIIDEKHQIIAVVGMDVPATTYKLIMGAAGGTPMLLAICVAGVVYVRYQTWRRHQEDVRFRAEMLSIASHELRTPLTGLRWSQEDLLRQNIGTPAQKRLLQIMYDSTRRLQESIEDILQLASMESGKGQRLLLDAADVRNILEDIVVTQELTAARRNVTIGFSAEWPRQVVLRVDGQRMKRVFHIVLSNAVKYSNKDTKVMIGYAQSKTGEFIISVRDEGIGIPKDEQAAVWGGFYRATNTRQRDVNGTGMGLYLARNIIEQHGGRMWLESEEGKGTTVFVALPKTVGEDAV